jgi:myo-inositol-1(or 4)-monophosphatase
MAIRSPTMNVLVRAVERAGRGLIRDFGEVENLQVSRKGPADFVSQADLKAQKTLVGELTKARPDYGFVLEEGKDIPSKDGRHRFLIDPLDGTTNFLHGIPHFAISVGLERDGELIAGVVYNPVTVELFSAEKGQGAYLNDRRIRVSARRDLSAAVIGTGIPHLGMAGHDRFSHELAHMMPRVAGIRRTGSAALDLAYVAAGRFDGYWEFGLNPWDMAAGIALVTEAGGYVSEVGGGRSPMTGKSVLAANAGIHIHLGKVLRSAGEDAAKARESRDRLDKATASTATSGGVANTGGVA